MASTLKKLHTVFINTESLSSNVNRFRRNSSSHFMIKARFTTNTWRLTFLIQGSPHNILSDIILLGQVEELADLAGPFGAEAAGDSAVGQPRDVLLA